jgi:protein gp37
VWGPNSDRRVLSDKHWAEPLKWDAEAKKEGRPWRVFSSSMCDNFEDHKDVDQARERLWPLIRRTPNLHWQLLTKRIERVADRLPKDWGNGYPNVWIGTSVENQKYADLRIPILLSVPAVVRFVSYEPALGPVDFKPWIPGAVRDSSPYIDWIISGGESGPDYRPMDVQWARDARDQCKAAGVAFFFKQSAARLTETGTTLDGEKVHEFPIPRVLG